MVLTLPISLTSPYIYQLPLPILTAFCDREKINYKKIKQNKNIVLDIHLFIAPNKENFTVVTLYIPLWTFLCCMIIQIFFQGSSFTIFVSAFNPYKTALRFMFLKKSKNNQTYF